MRARRRHAVWVVVTFASALTAVPPARATPTPPSSAPAPRPSTPAPAPPRREPTAGDLATARSALREGIVLRDKGELNAALARLASAYDLVPTPVTGFELGKTHMMLGHVLQAHELFKKVVRMPPSLEESTRSEVARDESLRLAKELEPRIPSLRLKLDLPPGATAVVRVDDETISTTGVETLRAVDPGRHEIVAKAGDGPEQKVHVEVDEAETKDVPLSPRWIPPKKSAPGTTERVILVRQTNPLALVGFGVAGAALVVTAIGGILWVDAVEEARSRCGEQYCPPKANETSGGSYSVADRAYDEMTTKSGVMGIITVVGALTTVTFAVAGVAALSRPLKERVVARTVSPVFGAGSAGLAGTF